MCTALTPHRQATLLHLLCDTFETLETVKLTIDNLSIWQHGIIVPTAPMLKMYFEFCIVCVLYFVLLHFVFRIQAAWYLISMVNVLPAAPKLTIYFLFKPKSHSPEERNL